MQSRWLRFDLCQFTNGELDPDIATVFHGHSHGREGGRFLRAPPFAVHVETDLLLPVQSFFDFIQGGETLGYFGGRPTLVGRAFGYVKQIAAIHTVFGEVLKAHGQFWRGLWGPGFPARIF